MRAALWSAGQDQGGSQLTLGDRLTMGLRFCWEESVLTLSWAQPSHHCASSQWAGPSLDCVGWVFQAGLPGRPPCFLSFSLDAVPNQPLSSPYPHHLSKTRAAQGEGGVEAGMGEGVLSLKGATRNGTHIWSGQEQPSKLTH